METTKNYRINTPTVVQETIDGEAVIIDFITGSYFSLNDVGTYIWNLIEKKVYSSYIIKKVSSKYRGEEDYIASSINLFIEEILKENLIVLSEDCTKIEDKLENENKAEFKKPELKKYSDMQELLLLDPIHEADETGWPNAAATS